MYDEEKTLEVLKNAVYEFYQKDFKLLNINVSERAMVFRIACYLEKNVKKLDTFQDNISVDCEYNRSERNPKQQASGILYVPDLCIHERGSNDHNFLCVEFKKKGGNHNGNKKDKKTLECMTSQESYGLGYQLGLHIHLYVKYIIIDKYKNGSIVEKGIRWDQSTK